jgi:hypothetical protein
VAVAATLEGLPTGVVVPVGVALSLGSALGEGEGDADDCVGVGVGEEVMADGLLEAGGSSGTPARTPPATEPSRTGLS